MTLQEVLKVVDKVHNYPCPYGIGGTVWRTIRNCIEKQIPKKPYKIKEHKQNDYYCAICKCYLGDEMELQNACLQPKYCEHCGQKLLWEGDTE